MQAEIHRPKRCFSMFACMLSLQMLYLNFVMLAPTLWLELSEGQSA